MLASGTSSSVALGVVGVDGGEGEAPVITSMMVVWRLVGHGSRTGEFPEPCSL